MKNIKNIVEILKQKKLTLSTCESATCGFLASMFGMISGVSEVYKGGLITYSNDSKVVLASVNPETINKFGAVSEEVAEEMALNVANILETSISISVTGNAGPNPMENKQVGKFWVGVNVLNKVSTHELVVTKVKNREYVIKKVSEAIAELLFKILSL